MRPAVCAVFLVLLIGVGMGAENLPLKITTQSVDYHAATRKAKIKVSCEAPSSLVGIKVAVILQYSFHDVGEVVEAIGPDGTFSGAILESSIPLPPDEGYELYVYIREEDQAERILPRVKELNNLVPFQGKVTLGSAQDRAAADKRLVADIKDLLDRAVAANNGLVDELRAAEKKEKYQSGGSFDAAAWRKFMDGTWRKQMIELQGEFASWLKKNPAYAYRYESGVIHLDSLLKVIAARSVLRSRQLYALMRVKPALEDVSPPQELETRPKYWTVDSEKKAKELLGKCYRLVKEDFKLDPPKKPAKAPAKKPDSKKPSPKKASPKKAEEES